MPGCAQSSLNDRDNTLSCTVTGLDAGRHYQFSVAEVCADPSYVGTEGYSPHVITESEGIDWTDFASRAPFTCPFAMELDFDATGSDIISVHAPGPHKGRGCHLCESAQHSNWYYFTAATAKTVVITSCSPGIGDDRVYDDIVDTRLYVWSGSECNSLLSVATNDNFPSGYESTSGKSVTTGAYCSAVSIDTVLNQRYYIEFDNRWSEEPFTFSVLPPPYSIDYEAPTSKLDIVYSSIITKFLDSTPIMCLAASSIQFGSLWEVEATASILKDTGGCQFCWTGMYIGAQSARV